MGVHRGARWFARSIVPAVLLTLAVLVPMSPASAASIDVTTTVDEYNDPGPDTGCSLREAAKAANDDTAFGGCSAGSGHDTINIPAGVHLLSLVGDCGDVCPDENGGVNGDIDLYDEDGVTVQGTGMDDSIVDGNGPVVGERVFDVREGDASFFDLSVRNGDGRQYGQRGGGIFYHASGTLTVEDASVHKNAGYRGGGIGVGNGDADIRRTEVANNIADLEGDGDGGGIYVDDGLLLLEDSSVVNNYANDYGGGIKAWGLGVHIVRSTIAGNSTTWGNGGGLWLQPPSPLLEREAGGAMQPGIYLIEDSTITGNTAAGDLEESGEGGGLFVEGCCGAMEIYRTTFHDNSAALGGGIFNAAGGTINRSSSSEHGPGLFMENTTITSNYALFAGGGLFNIGDAYLQHVTMYRNEAEEAGGGFYDDSCCSVEYVASIIAGNVHQDCAGNGFSQGYNVLGDSSCDSTATDVSPGNDSGNDVDPRLAPLRDNGGPTKTHALLPGSPAIDLASGNGYSCPPPNTDQRGLTRPTGVYCDSGAYEVGDLPDVGGEVEERDLRCRGLDPTIVGTSAGETLVGTPGRDVIQALEGADTIRGRGGRDVICGARGVDLMKGGRGNDILKGHRGDDVYRAGGGNDLCIPGPGDDIYKGCERPPQTVA